MTDPLKDKPELCQRCHKAPAVMGVGPSDRMTWFCQRCFDYAMLTMAKNIRSLALTKRNRRAPHETCPREGE